MTARRKRNQGRVRQLAGLRSQRRDWLRAPGTVNLATGDATRAGDLVLEARSLEKGYPVGDGETRRLIRDFSLKLKRGDRIGVIGRNGAGKTTLIRMLLKLEDPDRGHVRHGVGLEPVYFDQRRESLDPAWTPWRALCPDGGDKVDVQGKPRHVVSYLRDFLFGDAQATQPIASLSGRRAQSAFAREAIRFTAQPSGCWTNRPTTWTWRLSICCRRHWRTTTGTVPPRQP